jgi:hypothetical protein
VLAEMIAAIAAMTASLEIILNMSFLLFCPLNWKPTLMLIVGQSALVTRRQFNDFAVWPDRGTQRFSDS